MKNQHKAVSPTIKDSIRRIKEYVRFILQEEEKDWWKRVGVEAVYRQLEKMLQGLPWGQHGAYFLASYRLNWDGERSRELSRNGIPFVSLLNTRKGEWVKIHNLGEEREKLAQRRERNRAADAKYKAALSELTFALQREGQWTKRSLPGWEYDPGQHGGTFRRERDSFRVSADGAMYRAWGRDWQETPAEDAISQMWNDGDFMLQEMGVKF